MPGMTLYEVTLEGLQIADLLTQAEGELTPDVEARLDALMKEAPERIEAAAMVVRNLEANASACKSEAARLLERAKSFETQTEKLKERMTYAVDAAFAGKVKTARFTIYTQKNPDTVAVDLLEGFTIEMIAEDCPEVVRVKREVDKRALREMFERGEKLPEGVYVEQQQGTRSLRIR